MIKKISLSSFLLIFLSISSFAGQRTLTRNYYARINSNLTLSFTFKVTANIDESSSTITSIVSVSKQNVSIIQSGTNFNKSGIIYYAHTYQNPNTAEVAWSFYGLYLGCYTFTVNDFYSNGSTGDVGIPLQNPK